MDNLIERIKDNWLEWKSLPYAFVTLVMAFLAFANLPNLLSDTIGYLYLGLIFVGIFIIYVVFCAMHVSHMEKAGDAASNKAFEMGHKNKLSAWMAVIVGCVVLAIVIFLLLFATNNKRDGKYVIWSDEYRIALTPEVHNSYYLEGEKISLTKGKLNEYSKHCVFELDFDKDDTFTIKYRDNYLGMTPEQNGIGYSDSCTSIRWKLEEADEGVYYIINADEDAYLKWYHDKDNWTTNEKLIDKYREEYLICIEKVD